MMLLLVNILFLFIQTNSINLGRKNYLDQRFDIQIAKKDYIKKL